MPKPPRTISVADSLHQDPVVLAFQDYVQQRNACLQEAKFLQPNRNGPPKAKVTRTVPVKSRPTAKVDVTFGIANCTLPLQPPGSFETGLPRVNATAPLKPPGVFKLERVPSSHSLASTAASASVSPLASPKAARPAEQPFIDQSAPVRELRVEDLGNDHLKVSWPVPAGKLRGKDQQIISPCFELHGLSFKLMVKPKPMGDKKGQASFQKARGWGSVELKLMEGSALSPTLRLRISIGGGCTHGPIEHDFSNSTVAGLAINGSFFDFTSAVDPDSSNFVISLEVLPKGAQLESLAV